MSSPSAEVPVRAVVSYHYADAEAELRREQLEPHRVWIRDLVDRGRLLGAGSLDDGSGAILVFETTTRAQLEQDLASDPYRVTGAIRAVDVANWELRHGPWACSPLVSTGDDGHARNAAGDPSADSRSETRR
ncbi:YciI family protein [Compostimonas suwonensis]|uniref:Uncharacterized protein YciI n=1 Tax=Compostimonas suwonensis TaxID=1048394 RepID=A0A2M9BZG6_9MICO|nr:YciI family protein [Compostimonas suwonensis]PJJ63456.1 uncharacterized protein YciI [Compostimonas suwonensis]